MQGDAMTTEERKRHEAHMRRAIAEARAGMLAGQGGPFGALIANPAGEVLAVSHNEVTATNDCTMHAEIAALRKVGRLNLRGHTLYATGFPCIMCLGAILWSRLSTLYYCNDYGMAAEAGFDDEAFLHEMGRVFHCTPGPAGDIDLQHLAIRRLALPEGEALYAEWNRLEKRVLY